MTTANYIWLRLQVRMPGIAHVQLFDRVLTFCVAHTLPARLTCASTARLSVATRSRVLSSSSAFSLASVFLRFRMYACTQSYARP